MTGRTAEHRTLIPPKSWSLVTSQKIKGKNDPPGCSFEIWNYVDKNILLM